MWYDIYLDWWESVPSTIKKEALYWIYSIFGAHSWYLHVLDPSAMKLRSVTMSSKSIRTYQEKTPETKELQQDVYIINDITILSFCCYITVLISIKYYYIVPILWLDCYVTLVSNLLYYLITMVLCYSIPMSLCYSITLLYQDVTISYHYITLKPYIGSYHYIISPLPVYECQGLLWSHHGQPRGVAIPGPSIGPVLRRQRHHGEIVIDGDFLAIDQGCVQNPQLVGW